MGRDAEEKNIKERLQIFLFLGDFKGCMHASVRRKRPPKAAAA